MLHYKPPGLQGAFGVSMSSRVNFSRSGSKPNRTPRHPLANLIP
jgi:hypothetical protein